MLDFVLLPWLNYSDNNKILFSAFLSYTIRNVIWMLCVIYTLNQLLALWMLMLPQKHGNRPHKKDMHSKYLIILHGELDCSESFKHFTNVFSTTSPIVTANISLRIVMLRTSASLKSWMRNLCNYQTEGGRHILPASNKLYAFFNLLFSRLVQYSRIFIKYKHKKTFCSGNLKHYIRYTNNS